jgi:hypothetical protein
MEMLGKLRREEIFGHFRTLALALEDSGNGLCWNVRPDPEFFQIFQVIRPADSLSYLACRDRHQRQPFLATCFGQGKENHQESEGTFRLEVAVVNPEPMVPVIH